MAYQDLLKDTSAPDPSDKNAFLITIDDLNPGLVYPLEFRWKFKDGSFGKDWSNVYELTLPNEGDFTRPHFTVSDVTGSSGFISVTWDGKDYGGVNDLKNYDRVDIYIKDDATNTTTTFGDGSKPTSFFKTKGSKTIVAPAGKYIVKLKAVGATGKLSAFVPDDANDYLVTVTSGLTIEKPTLPIGLSASSVPFGIAINWTGGYDSGTSFFGFQSINIYASTSGSSSTLTSISGSSLVGTMSVNDTENKITVGLDSLRTALSLPSNSSVYDTNVYFYYIATNLNGEKYKVNGSEVYTRISSTPVKAQKANFIDLASGVISIENLIAGNGKFTSYLRTGTPGGARIELSGATTNQFVDDQTEPIVPGLTVYTSGSTASFQIDAAGNAAIGGYTKATLDALSSQANKGVSDAALASSAAQTANSLASTKNKIFVINSVPSAVAAGDVWVNTYNGTVGGYLGNYTNYVASASGTSSWTAISSVDAKAALGKIVGLNSDGTIFDKTLQLKDGSGAIYSNKASYASDDAGWYLGYNGSTAGGAISIGDSTGSLKFSSTDGLRIKGSITSTATITGGSLIGASIATSSNTAIKRIEIPESGNSILFKTASTDVDQAGTALSVDGYLKMDSIASPIAGTTGNYPGIKIQGPSASSYTGLSSLTMVNTPVGGATVIRGYILDLYGWVRIMGQPSTDIFAARNIATGVGAPSGGSQGDVYFQV